jgi:hypothetical protein
LVLVILAGLEPDVPGRAASRETLAMDSRETYLMPHVAVAAFPELLDLMVVEKDFPRTYAEWVALWESRRFEEERVHGYRVVFVDVVPATFAIFCRNMNFPTSWGALGQFLAAEAGR